MIHSAYLLSSIDTVTDVSDSLLYTLITSASLLLTLIISVIPLLTSSPQFLYTIFYTIPFWISLQLINAVLHIQMATTNKDILIELGWTLNVAAALFLFILSFLFLKAWKHAKFENSNNNSLYLHSF